MHTRLISLGFATSAVVAALLSPTGSAQGTTTSSTSSSTGITGTTRVITSSASTHFTPTRQGAVGRPARNELSPVRATDPDAARLSTARPGSRLSLGVNRSLGADGHSVRSRRATPQAAVLGAQAAAPGATVVRSGPQLLRSLQGLDHFDSRTADNGNQFSGEPPDQGLCVGNGKVVESVNSAIRVRDLDGTPHGVTSLNRFYGFPSAFVRPNGPFGPDLFDPTCVFDPQSGTFFHVVDRLGLDPATGAPDGRAYLDIAVTKDPPGAWKIYHLDVTDDGSNGTPAHGGCPCFGDYPHVGVDANGFYISTNEFPQDSSGFDGAQIYAFAKGELTRGSDTVHVTQFDTSHADRGDAGFTVWPAQSPTGADYSTDAGGTEYFLSSNAVNTAAGVSDNIVTWSLTGTSTLSSQHPTARLLDTRVSVPSYSIPPPVDQKDGPTPLKGCLNDPSCRDLLGVDPGPREKLQQLDSNDSRMQQVSYAGGRLYGALDTAVKVGGQTQAGIGWFVVDVGSTTKKVTASTHAAGQLGVVGNDVTYPAVAISRSGRGVMSFTLAGPSYYPSAAFSSIDSEGVGDVHVAAAGVGPQDGLSGYVAFNAPDPVRPRWGDYSAAAASGSTVWIASEYIGQSCTLNQYRRDPFGTCGGTRTALANWGTRVSQVKP